MTLQYQHTAVSRFLYPAVLNHAGRGPYQQSGVMRTGWNIMKIALLVVLGLVIGALGGAALGIGAGLAWVQIFRTTGFEDYNGVLVFFTFMPLGAAIGGLGGALLFGVIAIRDAEIALVAQSAFVQCKNADCVPGRSRYLKLQIISAASLPRRRR
jgi:hypothetical protein